MSVDSLIDFIYYDLYCTGEKTAVAVEDMTKTLKTSRVLADFTCSAASIIEMHMTQL